jgi:exodeoxyribonuclease-5
MKSELPPFPEELKLSEEQQKAVNLAARAVMDDELFKLGGYAGTGKTTVAQAIADQVPGCMPCAFTGKAAYRLREKGLMAQTIHSLIYYPDEATKTFTLRDDVEGDWFLIDEGSMISAELWKDLLSFGLPILLLGDPGQLEPVGNDPKLMHKPDVILEQIHRQAEGNGIIEFATDIRRGTPINPNIEVLENIQLGYEDVNISHGKQPTYGDLEWSDVIICGFNKTRVKINQIIRTMKNIRSPTPIEGERIICLKNDRRLGVFNGQMFTIAEIISKEGYYTRASCLNDMGQTQILKLYNPQFGAKKTLGFRDVPKGSVAADYAYCITCHKSQGSEWDNVLVIDEQMPRLWNATRWRYTAVTRASKKLKMFYK